MVDVNQNIPECIKSTDHFGSTTYYNICTHTQVDVLWGAFGWFEVALLFSLGIAGLALLCTIVYKMLLSDL